MTRYGRMAWHVIALAAFAGTAALAVTLTSAPEHATPVSEPTRAACATSGLEARLGEGRTASGVYYALEFTNVSSRACSLYGYPGVSAYAGTHQIGSAAALDTSVRPRTVMLAPGATAHSVLHVAGTGYFRAADCGQVTAPELRVFPPDQLRAALVPFRLPACLRRGPEFLSVQAVQARAGIQGFPRPEQ
jgi:Protein of unknown function (DUF4232)